MAKKIIALLLVLMIALCSMTSCFIVINNTKTKGEGGSEAQTNAPMPELPPKVDVFGEARKQAEDILSSGFSEIDMKDQTFSLVIGDDTGFYIQAEQETSYSKALAIQKDLIASKLNCDFYINVVSYGTLLSDAQAAKNAGLFYADLVCVPQKAVGYMRSQGMIYNLNELYGDDFNEDYFYSEAKNASMGSNAYYAVAGKASVTPASYYCIYFNRSIADRSGITGEIYDLVEEGNWTLDKMFEMKAKCNAATPSVYGLVSDDTHLLVNSLYGGFGLKHTNTAIDTKPTIAANNETLSSFVSKVQTLISEGNISYNDEMYSIFMVDGALFYVDTLGRSLDIGTAYGIVPLPKLNVEDKYVTASTSDSKVFVVLSTNNHPENVPQVLKAFNATGKLTQIGWARDLLDYAFCDSRSYKMAELIFDNPSYDFAYMYGESYQSVADSTYKALEDAVMNGTDFEKAVKKVSTQFGKYIDSLFP